MFKGTTLSRLFVGSYVKPPPEQIGARVMSSIIGFGFTVTTTSNGAPIQLPSSPETGVAE